VKVTIRFPVLLVLTYIVKVDLLDHLVGPKKQPGPQLSQILLLLFLLVSYCSQMKAAVTISEVMYYQDWRR
jgi:hypothetical protein